MECALSILICHMPERAAMLDLLMRTLKAQPGADRVEVLVNDSMKISIGMKRNALIRGARGQYVSFVDDDDALAPTYIPDVLSAITTAPDCVGIDGELLGWEGKRWRFHHSIDYAGWYESCGEFYRTPNHLNPTRVEIARQVGFPERRYGQYGEDYVYSMRLRPYLHTEIYVHKPLYIYNCPNFGRPLPCASSQ